jgi:recombination associated protein RdgC
MLFKQFQLFQLTAPIKYSNETLIERLEPFAFNPCLPSMPSSMGWVPPIEEEGEPLIRTMNGCIMLCLQLEEKILPSSVVAQALKDKIKKIEAAEDRRVRKKEKLSYKDELTQTLLMRAFTKFTRIQAYIDTKNNWLVLNTISAAKTELFLTMFKKVFGDVITSYEVHKPSTILTSWLKDQNYPTVFSIEKSCVLQDPNQQNRVIRAQQQDLFAESIQALVKEGCAVVQVGLCWYDRINFVLADDFSLRTIRLAEDDLIDVTDDFETKQQKFDADFLMLTETFAGLITDLLAVFLKSGADEQKLAIAV